MKRWILFVVTVGVFLVPILPAAPVSKVKIPDGFDAKFTSIDPDYGHSMKNPVKVGSKDDFGGPAAERAYLRTLFDDFGKPVRFERLGSYGAATDGHIVDGYEVVTSSGRKLTIYIDMYHPENDPLEQPAPLGLFKAKK